jgi:hypothetical protein
MQRVGSSPGQDIFGKRCRALPITAVQRDNSVGSNGQWLEHTQVSVGAERGCVGNVSLGAIQLVVQHGGPADDRSEQPSVFG